MPTIAKLPAADSLSATDVLAIDQGDGTHGVTLGTLLSGQQPAILAPSGTLLGRVSLGAGGPEAVSLGSGLVLSGGTLSLGGTLDGLLAGETVSELQAAAPARDTDAIAVDQGGTALTRQTFAALWTYIMAKLPQAKHRVVELTGATVLDATAHNDALLLCTQPLTLTANFANMGSGFSCEVINLSSGDVTMGTGITVGSGNAALPKSASARLCAVAYSGGNLVYWVGAGSSTTDSGSGGSSGGSNGGGNAAVLTFQTAPSGSYAPSQAGVGVNATLDPGTAGNGVQFGISASPTSAPASWTAGLLVNTQANGDTFWGAYLTMPATPGTYYCWAATVDEATTAVSAAFTVS